MKLRRGYKFRPYRPCNQSPPDWRDWKGWYLVGWGILFLVAVALVGVGHTHHGTSCLLVFGYLVILGSLIGMGLIVRYQRKQMRQFEKRLRGRRRFRRRKRGR